MKKLLLSSLFVLLLCNLSYASIDDDIEKARSLNSQGKYVEAAEIYERLANSGYAPAAYQLGEYYETGKRGISPNKNTSCHWYELGRNMQYSPAIKAYDRFCQ